MKMNECCEDCKFWKCMGYHYYECTNEASECNGQSMWRGETCNKFEEK